MHTHTHTHTQLADLTLIACKQSGTLQHLLILVLIFFLATSRINSRGVLVLTQVCLLLGLDSWFAQGFGLTFIYFVVVDGLLHPQLLLKTNVSVDDVFRQQ